MTLGSSPSQLEIRRIAYGTPAADVLLSAMDAEMGALYAESSAGFSPEVSRLVDIALTVHPEEMVAAVGAYDEGDLVGHAAVRPFEDALEVKRVYVRADHRGRGIAQRLMLEIEAIARERGVASLILQTGQLQTEAIALYEKLGYVPIVRFGAYAPIPFFLCFGKTLA